jgi:altronate dehydratase large subunit
MDTPGNDIEGNSALIAGGCQIICFTTGRGNPIGSPIAPVIKITGNPFTFEGMKDNIDIDAGTIIQGKESIKKAGLRIFDEIIAVASGKQTKAEVLGCREFCINRLGPSY